jgi:hypothetical protein
MESIVSATSFEELTGFCENLDAHETALTKDIPKETRLKVRLQ